MAVRIKLAPPAATTLPAPGDGRALFWLLASNGLTLALALVSGWPLGLLLWPFWVQSVVIGYFSYRRILGLERFSTAGFRINNAAVEPTPETQRRTARFFAIHYGFFHLGYALFLFSLPMGALDWLLAAVAAAGFFANHRQSFYRFRDADRQGCPNIGTLMFLPYLRIVPMHLTIIFGMGMAGGGRGALLIFGLLKIVADVAMHIAEHRLLARAGRAAS